MKESSKLHEEIADFVLAEDIIKNNKVVKRYLFFNTIEEFISMEDKSNLYYEVIDGLQKLYLDIDIPNPDKDYSNNLLLLRDHILSKYPDADINIYTSHRIDKQSYHIIISNYACNDNIQCKLYIEDIIKDFDNEVKKYIDMKVYKRYQLMRLLGSSKFNTDNKKISWIGKDDLKTSLISYTQYCKILDDKDHKYEVFDIRYYARKFDKSNRAKRLDLDIQYL